MVCPMLPRPLRPWITGTTFLLLGVVLGLQAPPERTLGQGIRAVYLHGSWIWAGLLGFLLAAGYGLWGLYRQEARALLASRIWAWMGLLFWLTALPLSLWAMQVNWNGLFLMEPRWRMALAFGVAGVLLQTGLLFLPLAWEGVANIAFALGLGITLVRTPLVLHPPMPVFRAASWKFPLHFLLTFASLAMAQWIWGQALIALYAPEPEAQE